MSIAKDVRFFRTWQRGIGYLLMMTVTVLFAVPVIYMVTTALRPLRSMVLAISGK